MGRCKLTGKAVDASLLNARDELIVLRDLLDGRSREAIGDDDMIPRIRRLAEASFRGLKHVWTAWLPGNRNMAVCGEVRSPFGMKVRYVGFLLKREPAFEITGQAVSGYRGNHGWVLEDRLELH